MLALEHGQAPDMAKDAFGTAGLPAGRGRRAYPLRAVDSAQMRAENQSLVLRLIWAEREISRADVARRTGLSRSTVSDIVGGLLAAGVLIEHRSGDSHGGRRPIILRMNEDAFVFAGIDVGATHVGVAVMTIRGEVAAWHHRRHSVINDPHGTLAVVREVLATCLSDGAAKGRALVGIGVAVPSPVHPQHPGKLSDEILPQWRGIDVRRVLADPSGLPVFVENDANVGALAEQWWGAGREGGDLVFIKIATGVGAGFIINGSIYRGAAGFSGELGHMVIAPRDQRQVGGYRGCLGAHVGSEALQARATDLSVRLAAGGPGRRLTVTDIADAALAGDRAARRIVREAGCQLGIAIVNLLHMLNPATVVLGGALSRAGELLLAPIRETVRQRTVWDSIGKSRLVATQLGERGVAMGAATQVIDAALANPALFPAANSARTAPHVG